MCTCVRTPLSLTTYRIITCDLRRLPAWNEYRPAERKPTVTRQPVERTRVPWWRDGVSDGCRTCACRESSVCVYRWAPRAPPCRDRARFGYGSSPAAGNQRCCSWRGEGEHESERVRAGRWSRSSSTRCERNESASGLDFTQIGRTIKRSPTSRKDSLLEHPSFVCVRWLVAWLGPWFPPAGLSLHNTQPRAINRGTRRASGLLLLLRARYCTGSDHKVSL